MHTYLMLWKEGWWIHVHHLSLMNIDIKKALMFLFDCLSYWFLFIVLFILKIKHWSWWFHGCNSWFNSSVLHILCASSSDDYCNLYFYWVSFHNMHWSVHLHPVPHLFEAGIILSLGKMIWLKAPMVPNWWYLGVSNILRGSLTYLKLTLFTKGYPK